MQAAECRQLSMLSFSSSEIRSLIIVPLPIWPVPLRLSQNLLLIFIRYSPDSLCQCTNLVLCDVISGSAEEDHWLVHGEHCDVWVGFCVDLYRHLVTRLSGVRGESQVQLQEKCYKLVKFVALKLQFSTYSTKDRFNQSMLCDQPSNSESNVY